MKISKREQEIIDLLSLGLSSKEIAQKLYISRETVASHRKNILSKTESSNVASLIRFAFEKGILQLRSSQVSKSFI